MTFRTLEEFRAYLLEKSRVTMRLMQQRVYMIFHRYVKQYYAEYDPKVYERTYQLYRSLTTSGIRSTPSGWKAEVYYDPDKLDYKMKYLRGWPVPGGYRHPYIFPHDVISPNGAFFNPRGSAEKTLHAAAHGRHGGWTFGTSIYDTPLEITSKTHKRMFKKAFKDAGLPVK